MSFDFLPPMKLPPAPAALLEEAAGKNTTWTTYSTNFKEDDPEKAAAHLVAQQKVQVQNLLEHMKEHTPPGPQGKDSLIETGVNSRDGVCTTVQIPQCFGGLPYTASIQVAGVSSKGEVKSAMEMVIVGMLFSHLRDVGASDAERQLIQSVLCSAIVPPCRTIRIVPLPC